MNHREIKFMAWHKPTNRMFEVYSLTPYNVYENSEDGVFSGATLPAVIEDCELVQYTGLKDKNGKEVYEGNVCTAKFTTNSGKLELTGTIEMDDFMWCLFVKDSCEWYSINRLHEVEVIGNVFETPELLNANA